MIKYNDFLKLDIRIGTIIEVFKVENADKLLKLIIDFGFEKRQILVGIAEFYDVSDLVGKQVPALINLEPKKLKGFDSQGMILVADEHGRAILLHPDKEILNGSKIF